MERDQMPDIVISVITVVYNGEKHIERAIKSVLNQKNVTIQYIIIDGNSTDRTLEFIEPYKSQIDVFISEPDNGIYDAMNKGIKCAKGELIAILNSDDYYANDNVLYKVSRHFGENHFIVGNTLFKNKLSTVEIRCDKSKHPALNLPFSHTATFIPMNIYKKVGLYDIRYSIAADIEIFFRIESYGFDFFHIDESLIVMSDGGASHKLFKLGRKEYKDIFIKYMPQRWFIANLFYVYSLVEFSLYNNDYIRKPYRFIKLGLLRLIGKGKRNNNS